MASKNENSMEKQLDQIIGLLRQNLALQLFTLGASQDVIAKNLKVSKTTANEILKGLKKGISK